MDRLTSSEREALECIVSWYRNYKDINQTHETVINWVQIAREKLDEDNRIGIINDRDC